MSKYLFVGMILIVLSLITFVVASESDSLESVFSKSVNSASGGFATAGNQLIEDSEKEEDSKQSLDPSSISFDVSNLEIINRSKNSDTYDYRNGSFATFVYASPVNIKDSKGNYKPYEEVTSFISNENEMLLQWNNKSVKLIFYTKDLENKKEIFSKKDKSEKNNLNFKTSIETRRGFYYFNHTFDKSNQPTKLGYEIETENVDCFVEGYSLVCGEQKINFAQAVSEQNLSVEINENSVEIAGDDLSYIDPSITQYADHTDTYCDDQGDTPEYDYHNDVLNDIGSDEISGGFEECNGLMQFYVDGFSSDLYFESQIDSVYFYIKTKGDIVSDEDNGASTDFCVIDDLEDYDWSPDDEEEEEEIFERLEDCSFDDFLFNYDFDENEEYTWFSWRIDTLDNDVLDEIIDNMDGSPDDALSIGIEGERDSGDDERVDFYDEDDGVDAPYIVVNWHYPSPTTSHSATSPPGGASYSSNNWTAEDVGHSISCSGECSYVQYCIGSGCTPSGNYGSFEYITNSNEYTNYFRWRGVYLGTSIYYENTQEYVDKIDKTGPTTIATAITNGLNYSFGTQTNNSVQVTFNCNDESGIGCKENSTKYCIDLNNSCIPSIVYSSPVNISTLGISYIRFYSEDELGNLEDTKNKTININKPYPKNVIVYVNESVIFEHEGYFTDIETTKDFSQELNSVLSSCTADEEGYCNIPIKIHSNNSGILNISNINIYYNTSEYYWDISNLKFLSTYRARIKSTDGLFNSSWDSSDTDFEIGPFSLPNDTNKFYIKNSSGDNVASFGDSGNVILSGECSLSQDCDNPFGDSFIFKNSSDEIVAYVDSNGNLCIEDGNCNGYEQDCNPSEDAFIIQSPTSENMTYIDFSGKFCTRGGVYDNVLVVE